MILDAGLDAAFERHVRLGRATRAGLKAMGLELFSPDDDSSAVVTAARTPDGIESPVLLRHLRERHGVTLAPGQGALKANIFRIGHIGWFDVFDIAAALAAVELSLDRARRRHRARRRRRPRVRGVRAARCRLRCAPCGPSRSSASLGELRAAAVEATVQEFPEGTPTAEAAAAAVGCRLDQIVKSLVFVCDGALVLAMVPGDRRADEARVAEAVGAEQVRIARAPGRWSRRPASSPAAVAPFPLAAVDEVLIERTLLQHDTRLDRRRHSRAHGRRSPPAELQRLSGARAADLVGPR